MSTHKLRFQLFGKPAGIPARRLVMLLMVAVPGFYLAGCGRRPAAGTPPNPPLRPGLETTRAERSDESAPAAARPAPPPKARDEVPSSVVLAWSREGGIAGFCDELKVTVAGEFTAKSCKATAPQGGKLAAAELARLERWRGKFGAVNLQTKDSPVADAMTLTLTLRGNGRGQPNEAEGQEMLDWAQAIFGRNQP